jgi:UrcA family protein
MDPKMTKSHVAHVLGLSLAASALLAFGEPAKAQPDDQSTNVRVNFADLDINHPAGAEGLLKRIERAANTACGGEPGAHFGTEMLVYQQCRTDAITRAVDRVNAPLLTAVAAGRIKLAGNASH